MPDFRCPVLSLLLVFSADASDRHKIIRVESDGSGMRQILTDLPKPTDVIIDPAHDRLWWVDQDLEHINYATRAGKKSEKVLDLLGPQSTAMVALKLDLANGKMYFTDVENGIRRANIDGSDMEQLIKEGYNTDIDISDGKMYWTDQDGGKIRRANLDGSGAEDVITDPEGPRSVLIHGGKVYWCSRKGTSIRRAHLDGTVIEDIIPNAGSRVLDIEILNGQLLWTDFAGGKIRTAAIDGTGVVTDLVTGLSSPTSLAVDTKTQMIFCITSEREYQERRHDEL